MKKRRIISLFEMYNKLGEYLHKYGDAHVTSISTHCNHPDKIYYTFNLESLYDDTERKIDIKYLDTTIEENKTEDTLNILCVKYIEDTSCDGQLFCGCRSEDCEKYQTQECIDCLKKQLKKYCLEEGIKKVLKAKIERN